MRTGRWWVGLGIVALGAAGVVACVGDDPTPVSPNDDAGSDTGGGTDGNVVPPPGSDASSDGPVDAGHDAAVNCIGAQPQLFPPIPGEGTFCQGAAGNHCAFAEHCCRDLTLNTQRCAASCDAGVADIECANTTECATGICCGRGIVRTDACPYLAVQDFTQSSCQTSCASNDFQLCSANADCNDGGKTCTPAKVLLPDESATSTAQISACR